MSYESDSHDNTTPMPRDSQESQYFPRAGDTIEQVDYGVTSLRSEITTADSVLQTSDSHGEQRAAQDELVSRALTPDNIGALSGQSQGSRRIMTKDHRSVCGIATPVSRSESAMSSRPGTPMSAPSNLPVPSNPSSSPDDQQLFVPGPILVMPSMQGSQIRPYTAKGRDIGKLRILFCGDSGSGKTTLLRTIVQQSADIVHFQHLTGSEPGRATTEINEVKASSQPFPPWKRPSGVHNRDDYTMEHNLCLVDTPGYGLSAEADDAIDPILRYLACQFDRTNEVFHCNGNMDETDFLTLVAAPSGGLTHIDVAIYCIAHSLSEIDLTFIRKLSEFTTVIPVVTKIDVHDSAELLIFKQGIIQQLEGMHFEYLDQAGTASPFSPPHLISCIDPEIEASIMMQDDYKSDLMPSDLHILQDALFQKEQPAKLRHFAARKFLSWKARRNAEQSLVHVPESDLRLLPSADFTVSRIHEHTQREDRKARIRLSAWAEEMQSSFTRQSMLQNGFNVNEKSAEWLITRFDNHTDTAQGLPDLSAFTHDDTILEKSRPLRQDQHSNKRYCLKDAADPLGLLRFREKWTRRLRKTIKWCFDVGFALTGVYLCYNMWQKMVHLE